MPKEEIYWLLFVVALVLILHFVISLGIKFLRKDTKKRPWSRQTGTLSMITLVKPLENHQAEKGQVLRYGYERRYRYRFQGQEYEHICVDYTDGEEEARQQVAVHRPGETVTLFVNRQNPEMSRLG